MQAISEKRLKQLGAYWGACWANLFARKPFASKIVTPEVLAKIAFAAKFDDFATEVDST